MTRQDKEELQASIVLALLGSLFVVFGIESRAAGELADVWVSEVAFGGTVLFAALVLAVWKRVEPDVAVGPVDTQTVSYLVGFGPALVAGTGLYLAGFETLQVVGMIVVGVVPIGIAIALSIHEGRSER